MLKKINKASICFENNISILETASIVGNKEGEGPLAKYFDVIEEDPYFGQDSWEKAESKMVKNAIGLLLKKSSIKKDEIDFIISGDLLNQSTASTFGVKDYSIPFLGIYSACSNIGEAMILGSVLLDGYFATNVIANASSHFCSAEKQFRSPLELGGQRPQTSTWTITGDGCMLLSKNNKPPFIKRATIGKIIDLGVSDPFNMGAAMAPAAADTIFTHLSDFNLTPDYYDLIITGDLGYVGKKLVIELLKQKGIDISNNFSDCGIKIFDKEKQDTHSGGSGCGCSAVTFSGFLYDELKNKNINKLLFVPTGALLSSISVLQKESIPGIAHAICIENK